MLDHTYRWLYHGQSLFVVAQEFDMNPEAESLTELLNAHRRTTGLALRQRALFGRLHVPPSIDATIDDGRVAIQRVKEALQVIGCEVTTLPIIDEANDLPIGNADMLEQLQSHIRHLENTSRKRGDGLRLTSMMVMFLVIGMLLGILGWLAWNNLSGNTSPRTAQPNENDAGANDTSIPLSALLPFHIDSYSGDSNTNTTEDQDNVQEKLRVIHNVDGSTSYKLEYGLPRAGFGYAGFQFAFDNPRNISNYKYIEVDIEFDDNTSGCSLKVVDNEDKFSQTRILGPNRIFRIPLIKVAGGVNTDSIKSIEFVAITDFSRGDHYFIVHDAKLVK
jgi:hypothetical protein